MEQYCPIQGSSRASTPVSQMDGPSLEEANIHTSLQDKLRPLSDNIRATIPDRVYRMLGGRVRGHY